MFTIQCNKRINKIHLNFRAKNLQNKKIKKNKYMQSIYHRALKTLKTKKNSVSLLLAFKTIYTNSHLRMMIKECRT